MQLFRLEMNEIRKNSFLKAIHLSFNVFLTRTLIYSCVVVHVLLGNNVNPQYIFGLSLFYELLRQCLSQAFAQGVAQVAEAIISTRRIKEFLLYDELEPEFTLTSLSSDKNQKNGLGGSLLVQSSVSDSSKPIGISLANISTKWIKSHEELALKGVDFEVNPGELATIIGKRTELFLLLQNKLKMVSCGLLFGIAVQAKML